MQRNCKNVNEPTDRIACLIFKNTIYNKVFQRHYKQGASKILNNNIKTSAVDWN